MAHDRATEGDESDYNEVYDVPQALFKKHPTRPYLYGLNDYRKLYHQSITEPDRFWGKLARELLSWTRDFVTTKYGSLQNRGLSWFMEGQLNASFNCIDRHAIKNPNKPAILFEGDDPTESATITYGELLTRVSNLCYFLKQANIRKGDTVVIYMPMIPEAIISILACARVGAIHTVIFAGFSSSAIRDRVLDAQARLVITCDECKRGGKKILIKKTMDEALSGCPLVSTVLVHQRTGGLVNWVEGRDLWWNEELSKYPDYFRPETLNSDDPLFLLYTSGSTGMPKGILHTTGGYLVGAAATGKYVFDLHDSDIFFCTGDVGWITGHTYVVYAPLLLGVTTVVFEGTPGYPNFSRFWDIVEKHKITHLYTAPTALRFLKMQGDQHVCLPSKTLRVLGSVGEPIAPDVWKWFHQVVGQGEAHIVDTYWQTETGSNMITALAGVTPNKPGCAGLPFFGVEPAIIDPLSGKELQGDGVEGVLVFKQGWPSMAKSVWNSHQRYMQTYLDIYKGYYFTGDGAARDSDGFYWIRGRVDDVVNVSGHRISTAEIESSLMTHEMVAECAAFGIPDELTGQSLHAMVRLKTAVDDNTELEDQIRLHVRRTTGAFAAPKTIMIVKDLPKTRSGKLMRRVLRKIMCGEQDQLGDLSTLSDPSIIPELIETVQKQKKRQLERL